MNRDSDTIIILSLVKLFNHGTPPRAKTRTLPDLIKHSAGLTDMLRKLSSAQIGTLMYIPDPLAVLNTTRYADWSPESTAENSKQVALAFDSNVYSEFDTNLLTVDDLQFVQKHLRILSGLYGVLCPFDQMQLYCLETGTRLANPHGKDLCAFQGDEVTLALSRLFKQDDDAVPINLASKECLKMAQPRALKTRIIISVFKDWKNGQYRIISFYAKCARGLIARYVIEHRITGPRKSKTFDVDSYAFIAADPDNERQVFCRKLTW